MVASASSLGPELASLASPESILSRLSGSASIRFLDSLWVVDLVFKNCFWFEVERRCCESSGQRRVLRIQIPSQRGHRANLGSHRTLGNSTLGGINRTSNLTLDVHGTPAIYGMRSSTTGKPPTKLAVGHWSVWCPDPPSLFEYSVGLCTSSH